MSSDESVTDDSGDSVELENEEERKRKRKFMTKAALAVNPARSAAEIFGQKIVAHKFRLGGLLLGQDDNNQKTCQSVFAPKDAPQWTIRVVPQCLKLGNISVKPLLEVTRV